MSFTALILAGSRGGADPVAAYAGVADKALIEIGGATMLARVVTALREAGADRIAVSASCRVEVDCLHDRDCLRGSGGCRCRHHGCGRGSGRR